MLCTYVPVKHKSDYEGYIIYISVICFTMWKLTQFLHLWLASVLLVGKLVRQFPHAFFLLT